MAELGVVAVGVAPVDVAGDQLGLGGMVGVVGAVEAEVAEPLELRLDPVEPGGVVGRVGEFDVVAGGPSAHLVAFVDGEVVEHEGESRLGRVAGADLRAEGEELEPCLVLADLATEQIVGDVERAEQVADAVRAGVGGADPARSCPWRPGFPVRLRLQVERPELVQADDDVGSSAPCSVSPSAIAYSSRIRFFLSSKAGSFERFQVLTA